MIVYTCICRHSHIHTHTLTHTHTHTYIYIYIYIYNSSALFYPSLLCLFCMSFNLSIGSEEVLFSLVLFINTHNRIEINL